MTFQKPCVGQTKAPENRAIRPRGGVGQLRRKNSGVHPVLAARSGADLHYAYANSGASLVINKTAFHPPARRRNRVATTVALRVSSSTSADFA